jgi:hypothetical protein
MKINTRQTYKLIDEALPGHTSGTKIDGGRTQYTVAEANKKYVVSNPAVQDAFQAAGGTLTKKGFVPFNTPVKVTNAETNASVTGCIRDTGPQGHTNINKVEVSQGAFKELGATALRGIRETWVKLSFPGLQGEPAVDLDCKK